jgi:serine/threonine-protein kinase
MPTNTQLDDLLLRWEELRDQGKEVALDELCRDCPQLRPALAERVRLLCGLGAAFGTEATTDQAPPTLPGDQPVGQPGERFQTQSHFRLVRFHARGGLGEVLLVHDEDLQRDVALKRIQQTPAPLTAQQDRFLREAEITARLEHPGVVPVYGLGQDAAGRPCYAMRFIEGQTLREGIERLHTFPAAGQTPAARGSALRPLLSRFVAVCNAVAYAHSRGVVHRDLKPANILLGPYGETLVVDWGLAKHVGIAEAQAEGEELLPAAQTQTGAVLGTPSYMSPEQAAGRGRDVGPASDVYSLGATLYTLVTGHAPVLEASTAQTLDKVRRGDFPPPRARDRAVPPALEAICLAAMRLKPEDRYGSALALATDVEHFLADEPVSAYREPWLGRLGRWGRRHRPLVASAAALLLTAVAALVVGLVAVNREKTRTREALAAESQPRQQTRAALDEMSSQVIEDWLSRRGQLEPAQQAFLEKALSYYEAFAAESGNSEEVRHSVADAHLRVGQIRARLGQHAQAEAAYRRALELGARLTADFPAVPQHRQQLASSHKHLGILLARTGREKEAEQAYRDALAIQKPLTEDFPAAAQYRLELGSIHNNLANLLEDASRAKEAEQAYRAALALYQPLAQEFPSAPVYRQEMAATYNNLGILLMNTSRVQESEDAYRKALAIQKPLVDAFPAVPLYRLQLARSHNNLGLVLQQAKRAEEAEQAYRDALVLRKELAADFPAVPLYRQELARSHNNLGWLFKETDRPREAEAAYRDALAIKKALADDFRAVPEYRQDLARGQNNLGELFKHTGRPQEAEAAYREALAIRRALVSEFPPVPDHQARLAHTLVDLAELARGRKDHSAARQLLEEARPQVQAALDANPRQPFFREVYRNHRRELAATLLDQGEHVLAAQAATDLAGSGWQSAADSYQAACFLSRCIPLAEQDSRVSKTQRQQQARCYGDQALEMLRKALSQGYRDADHLKKDKDLEPLRAREDLKQLLIELPKAKPKVN